MKKRAMNYEWSNEQPELNECSLNGQVWGIAPMGRLDAMTVPQFEQALKDRVSAGELQLLVDMKDVSYVSSSGLRALLTVRRLLIKQGGDLKLCRLSPRIYKVFEMVGFTKVFGIYESVEAALGE